MMDPVVNIRSVPATRAVLHLHGTTYFAAPILAISGKNYSVEGDVEVDLKPGGRYFVKGVLSKNYSAVWLEDSKGNIVSDKVEKGDPKDLGESAMAPPSSDVDPAYLANTNFDCVRGSPDDKAGCQASSGLPVVKEARGAKPINALLMTCNSPYKLTQDCSIWSGAKRPIDIGGREIKVAATADGKAVLVMDSLSLVEVVAGPYEPNVQSKRSNSAYVIIKKALEKQDISIHRVRPLRIADEIQGYVLELSGDGYSVLKQYSSG
jgi:hypothetical protein